MSISEFYLAFIFSNLTLSAVYLTAISTKETSKNSTDVEFKYTVNELRNSANYTDQKHSIKRRFIIPGSLWCGVGNVAIHNDDIGKFHKTDRCCRDRDLCGLSHKEILLHFETNVDMATKLFGKPVCKCELEFYICLRRANTLLSRNLGRLYFSIIRPKCYIYDHPALYCVRFQGFFHRRCLEYHVDTNARMRVETRDNPLFF